MSTAAKRRLMPKTAPARTFPKSHHGDTKEESGMWYYSNVSSATLTCRDGQPLDSAPATASVAPGGVVCVQRRVQTYVDRLAVTHVELVGGHGWLSDRKAPLYTRVLHEDAAPPQPTFKGEEWGSWAYENSTTATVGSRSAPEFPGTRTSFGVGPRQTVRVVRRLRQQVGSVALTFLELAAGRGWVFDVHPNDGSPLLVETLNANATCAEPIQIETRRSPTSSQKSAGASSTAGSESGNGGALLYGRFALGSLRHMSSSSCVYICTDAESSPPGERVALKMCRDAADMRAEMTVRHAAGLHRGGGVVIDVLWSNARSKPRSSELEITHDARPGSAQAPLSAELRALAARYPYAFAMPVADCDLLTILARIDVATTGAEHVRSLLSDVARLLQALHAAGVVHGEVGATNILQKGGRWYLGDLDASAAVGDTLGAKAGAATLSPEATRARAAGDTVAASVGLDVWAFGLLAYRICTRNTPLLTCNSHGVVIHAEDAARLLSWGGLANEEILGDHFLPSDAVDEADRLFARDLVGWCLTADAADRPQSAADILAHRFLVGPCADANRRADLRCLASDGRTQLQYERMAAEMLQSIYRGRSTRAVHAERIADQVQMNKAALKLQGIQRGRVARGGMDSKRAAVEDEEMNSAALKLQGRQRSRVAKAKVAAQRSEAETLNGAALTLQGIQRGRVAKKRVAEQRSDAETMNGAALSLQGIQRGRVAKRRAEQQRIDLDAQMADEGEDFFAMLHAHRDQ